MTSFVIPFQQRNQLQPRQQSPDPSEFNVMLHPNTRVSQVLLKALKLSFEVSKDTLKSRSDCRRSGLGSLLFFLFCFSVLVLGRTGKEKVCDKTNAPWDTEWDLRSSHWPNHRLKTPSLPFYRFISSVFRFSSFIPKSALIKGTKIPRHNTLFQVHH